MRKSRKHTHQLNVYVILGNLIKQKKKKTKVTLQNHIKYAHENIKSNREFEVI